MSRSNFVTTAWASNGRDVEKIEGPVDPKQLKETTMKETKWSKTTGDDVPRIKEDSICIYWHISDVKEIKAGLTDDQCRQVLQDAAGNHNADIGINWEVLEATANTLFSQQLDLLSGSLLYKSNPITLKQESKDGI